MNREEATLLGFEIVAYAGEARSYLLDALKAAEKGDYDKAEALCEEANTSIIEAQGDDIAYSVTMMHGQDHLMTTLLLRDLMKHMIELYKRGSN